MSRINHASCTCHTPPRRIHPQRQQPSTEQAIEAQREQPFDVNLPQCATEHARHAEDRVTRMLQSPWLDEKKGKEEWEGRKKVFCLILEFPVVFFYFMLPDGGMGRAGKKFLFVF